MRRTGLFASQCIKQPASAQHHFLIGPLLSCILLDSCPCTGIEDLREKREEVNRSIAKDEEEKGEHARILLQSPSCRATAHVTKSLLPGIELTLCFLFCSLLHRFAPQRRSRMTCGS